MAHETDWKGLVRQSPWAEHLKAEYEEEAAFGPPASEAAVRGLEEDFGVTLPAELRSFLAAADGVENDGLYLILNVEGLAECNRDFRSDDREAFPYRFGDDADPDAEQPVDHFFVISNMLGNGDFYAVCLTPVESFLPGNVVHWDHETNGRSLVAQDLKGYIGEGNPGVR